MAFVWIAIIIILYFLCSTFRNVVALAREALVENLKEGLWRSVSFLDSCLLRIIRYLSHGRDFLARYQVAVREHREESVVTLVQRWMMNDMEACDRYAHGCARAVSLVISKVGLRDRNPMSVESVQRAIRDNLIAMRRKDLDLMGWNEEEELFDISDISYWSEVGTQFYFNPPFDVRASMGVLPGFH